MRNILAIIKQKFFRQNLNKLGIEKGDVIRIHKEGKDNYLECNVTKAAYSDKMIAGIISFWVINGAWEGTLYLNSLTLLINATDDWHKVVKVEIIKKKSKEVEKEEIPF